MAGSLKKFDKVEIEWVDTVEGDKKENEIMDLVHQKNVGYFLKKDKELFAICFGQTLENYTTYKYSSVLRIPIENVKKVKVLK